MTTVAKDWFEVSKKGLAKLVERRGKASLVLELIQNAFDEKSKDVAVVLTRPEGGRALIVSVTDDNPDGFKDLAHAYTLFAESTKLKDPEKRGRFNLGEKLFLAYCTEAEIRTTTGAFYFDEDGRHVRPSKKTKNGSIVEGRFPCTEGEYEEIRVQCQNVIPPEGVDFWVNGFKMSRPTPLQRFHWSLQTEYADEMGVLRRTMRLTEVEVFPPLLGEPGLLFEMGIPVVTLDMPYRVNVMQRVPLNMERDNVTPAYAKAIHVAVLNHMHKDLTKAETNQPWVTDALTSDCVSKEAVEKVMTDRYGTKRVAFDPSDLEANNKATAEGYKVIHGGSLPADAWRNVRTNNVVASAGSVFPTKHLQTSPEGVDRSVPESEWTDGMKRAVEFVKHMSRELLGHEVPVDILKLPIGENIRAAFEKRTGFLFNLTRLGYDWFSEQTCGSGPGEDFLALILHEFAHHYEANHLDAKFHKAQCDLGARLAWKVARGLIRWHGSRWSLV